MMNFLPIKIASADVEPAGVAVTGWLTLVVLLAYFFKMLSILSAEVFVFKLSLVACC